MDTSFFNHSYSAFVEYEWFFYTVIFIFGLTVGSFLNVVIHRLPLMLEKEWRSDCKNFLELEPDEETTDSVLTLSKPDSRCPSCGHKIRIWENIPVISYLFLGGKCSSCKTPISIQYPLIELITAALSVLVAIQLGVTSQMLLGLVLLWALVALTVIDIQKQLLPDNITLPLLWLGLLANTFNVYTDLSSSVYGAIVGYLSLWSVYKAFKFFTGKEGMGYGDFKLLAALGAWMGWQMLPQIILLSSLVGAIIGITMMLVTRHDKNIPIPFGPYLAIAGLIAFLWGADINRLWIGI